MYTGWSTLRTQELMQGMKALTPAIAALYMVESGS